jgi:hypothetical protein
MWIIPIKLLPWLLLISGIVASFTDERDVFSILMAIFGGVWVLLRFVSPATLSRITLGKWFPCLLLFSGISSIFTGNFGVLSIIFIVVGVGWIFFNFISPTPPSQNTPG